MMRLELTAHIVERMGFLLRRAGSKEIGGVLMAEQLSPGAFRLVDFSVDSETGGRAHFVRSAENHAKALTEFFSRTGEQFEKYNYLGEWHSHPNYPVFPSSEDMRSMRDLVEGERGIEFAALMIVRLHRSGQFECSAALFQKAAQPTSISLTYIGGKNG